jgi:EAL domain-containing protein (putative c-di-GMP-specific phosphodiesterase class I)/ActR/RegA family two-component response regulator
MGGQFVLQHLQGLGRFGRRSSNRCFESDGRRHTREQDAMNLMQNRLLVVDDEPAICTAIKRIAEPLGFNVQVLSKSAEFPAILGTFLPSIVILDLKMPDCDGVQMLQQLKEAHSEAQIIVISGLDQRKLNTAEKLGRSLGLNMAGVLHKPIRRDDLESKLSSALSDSSVFSLGELRTAIADRQLVVHYQPKVAYEGKTWMIDGAEALIRWQHPEQGLLPPGKFLPFVETYGLMGTMTDFVLETAVEQLAAWSGRGLSLKLAVNLAAEVLDDLKFPERIAELLAAHGVPGERLIIELTESTAMSDAVKAMDIFLRLCVNDICLSIDDFGTGFSSLQQLYQLPFDELKIDRMFVMGLPEDEEARAIMRATVDMAHALNIKVCAEGVESSAALKYLESVHCDRAQGYFISPPLGAEDFEHFIGEWDGPD